MRRFKQEGLGLSQTGAGLVKTGPAGESSLPLAVWCRKSLWLHSPVRLRNGSGAACPKGALSLGTSDGAIRQDRMRS